MSLTLAFIPARGGSKGISKKNLAILNGRPLISYTVELSKKLKVDDIFISSDDEEILSFCASDGISTKYRRPDYLSTDDASIVDAVIHGIEWYQTENKKIVENIILMQPTFPIRKKAHITNALNYFQLNNLCSLVSITPMREHPYECIEVDDGMNWNYLSSPRRAVNRRQDYSGRFGFIDGSFYISKLSFIKLNKSFVVPNKTYPFFTPQKYAIDIDDPEDLLLAEALININA